MNLKMSIVSVAGKLINQMTVIMMKLFMIQLLLLVDMILW